MQDGAVRRRYLSPKATVSSAKRYTRKISSILYFLRRKALQSFAEGDSIFREAVTPGQFRVFHVSCAARRRYLSPKATQSSAKRYHLKTESFNTYWDNGDDMIAGCILGSSNGISRNCIDDLDSHLVYVQYLNFECVSCRHRATALS